MEDILASIRRILSEDETPATGDNPPAPAASEPTKQEGDDGVLLLDAAMMVPEPTPAVAHEPPAIEEAPHPWQSHRHRRCRL